MYNLVTLNASGTKPGRLANAIHERKTPIIDYYCLRVDIDR